MIRYMSKFDHLDIDGRLLRVLLAVLDTGSVTGAAQLLGVTQSAVSHSLDKLRAIAADPLFVKSGRGIVATAHAQALAQQAREILGALERFAHAGSFDPAQWHSTVTIAANEYQRDLLLPALHRRLQALAPGVGLRVIASNVPTLQMLRDEACQLVISPRPPEGSDVLQKRLFADSYRVFYDPAMRTAPGSRAHYLAAQHVTVVYENQRTLDVDQWLSARGVHRRFAVQVPGFSGLAAFVRGSALLATAPGRLRGQALAGLADARVPVACPALPMYMVWHRRHHSSAAQRWLRAQLEAVAAGVVAR